MYSAICVDKIKFSSFESSLDELYPEKYYNFFCVRGIFYSKMGEYVKSFDDIKKYLEHVKPKECFFYERSRQLMRFFLVYIPVKKVIFKCLTVSLLPMLSGSYDLVPTSNPARDEDYKSFFQNAQVLFLKQKERDELDEDIVNLNNILPLD